MALTLFYTHAGIVSLLANLRQMHHLRHLILKTRNAVLFTLCLTFTTLLSCSPTKTFSFYCQDRQIEIYVDNEYLGRDLVHYPVSKDREYIEVSCREKGVEIYNRRINVKNRKGSLIELQIPKNYKYSSKPY